MHRFLFVAFLPALFACTQSAADTTAGGVSSGSGATGATGASSSSGSGGGAAACEASFDGPTIHLAVGAELKPGEDKTLCLRWTAPEDLDISRLVGRLGKTGHHALLMSQDTPTEPDGIAPCSEAELMDAQMNGGFQLLAGVSYETDGRAYDFPAKPVQIGLRVKKGAQLILDAHLLDTTPDAESACTTMDLERGKHVVVPLLFHTVLPKEEYGLAIPAHSTKDVSYSQLAPGKYRIAAASSHMHAGGTHFKMSIQETGQVLFETSSWADPAPALFDTQKVVIDADQSFKLDCSFNNAGAIDQHFPAQMCVGAMYLLTCAIPGAC